MIKFHLHQDSFQKLEASTKFTTLVVSILFFLCYPFPIVLGLDSFIILSLSGILLFLIQGFRFDISIGVFEVVSLLLLGHSFTSLIFSSNPYIGIFIAIAWLTLFIFYLGLKNYFQNFDRVVLFQKAIFYFSSLSITISLLLLASLYFAGLSVPLNINYIGINVIISLPFVLHSGVNKGVFIVITCSFMILCFLLGIKGLFILTLLYIIFLFIKNQSSKLLKLSIPLAIFLGIGLYYMASFDSLSFDNTYRIEAMRFSLSKMLDSPLYGFGLGSWRNEFLVNGVSDIFRIGNPRAFIAVSPHGFLNQYALELGLIGLLLFGVLISILLKNFIYDIEKIRIPYYESLGLFLIVTLVYQCSYPDNLYYSSHVVFAALCLSIINSQKINGSLNVKSFILLFGIIVCLIFYFTYRISNYSFFKDCTNSTLMYERNCKDGQFNGSKYFKYLGKGLTKNLYIIHQAKSTQDIIENIDCLKAVASDNLQIERQSRESLLLLAKIAIEEGNFIDGERYLLKLYKINPSNINCILMLIRVKLELNKCEEARTYLNKAKGIIIFKRWRKLAQQYKRLNNKLLLSCH